MAASHPVLDRLRAATDADHRRLETEAEAVARLADPARRPSLVQRYHALYAAADRLLAPWVDGFDGKAGRDDDRADRACADLRRLGMAPADPPPPPPIEDRAQALGFLYVIEGSSLGGRVILKELDGRGLDLAGLSFLDRPGGRVGEAWRCFVGVLEREIADEAAQAAAERGARAGFAYARECLCGSGIAVGPAAGRAA